MNLKSYKKRFPYICHNCGKFTRTYSEYCENCGTSNSIRNTNDNNYTEENIMKQSKNKTIRNIPEDVLFTVKSFNEDVQKGKKLGADAYKFKSKVCLKNEKKRGKMLKMDYEELKRVAKLKDLDKLYEMLYENNELPGKSDGYMYIIRPIDENDEFIRDVCKIGETSFEVEKYVKRRILPRSPFDLKIIAVIRGRMWEMVFHVRYEEYRTHNEWFTFVPEMLQFIDLLKTKGYGRTKD